MSTVDWNGVAQHARTLRALQVGIDKTTAKGTAVAKRLVHVDTATLQGSIRPEPAQIVGETVVGQYGPHDVKYAEAQEFLPPERGGKPYMRPSQTEAEKVLKPNIANAYRSGT